MTREEKKYARQKLLQEQLDNLQAEWDDNFQRLTDSLSKEELADAEGRYGLDPSLHMNRRRDLRNPGVGREHRIDLFQYVYEIEEVKKAHERMQLIDKAILELSPEKKLARENRLACQKRAALTEEDKYLLDDAWGYSSVGTWALDNPQ